MKPPPFTYHAPRDLPAALRTLAEVGGKVLAGGQSLIPMLNMRLAAPGHVVDINRVAGLDGIEVSRAGVTVGALARHADVERAGAHPLLTWALKLVAHPAIRNRGTVVGSLVHADPAAELPAVLAVLGGHVRVARWDCGRVTFREIPAAEFFVGPMESAVGPGELAVSAFFPALEEGSGAAFHEVSRRHGDYALAGACAVVGVAGARVACIGVGGGPVVIDVGGDLSSAAARVRDAVDPDDDIHASAAYRRHLVGVLAERALRDAAREGAAARGA
ncbi:Carbon monoxide dehydrogenase medium chain [[Actinomadura] parvosata subsp. kistnae]|uniref:Molybdopterin dehydrogenase n=1 Tax=[Actinomadura] parvosata subsp. kistnae TaxID=1909395 RepID=A0A1U9ZQY8_9ACTN|nr:FAD binding domain-containing protein [Nonomuraea sp. ATCC 55076]AQZ60364.1 molybdopterin dehydrogenase [Nonomuraea sp. ATCC 55076]SPL91117.1 Carbon monoxide dehydrogenase medium chain [Actinomadura parvosata subsp. kistnae]